MAGRLFIYVSAMEVIEAMKERRSVRSFAGRPLSAEQTAELTGAAESVFNPFGGKVDIRLEAFDMRDGFRPSTYGMIRGASDFFLVAFADDAVSALSAGFCFEQVVLKAWEMGLGTCWIAATFKGSDFGRGEAWPAGERLRVVSPVGTADDKGLMEKFVRLTLGSKNRKPFGRLFFQDHAGTPLPDDSPFREALEMTRLAPSSRNSQPWRAVVRGRQVHFFSEGDSPLAPLDCGIGICHFYETERFRGRSGSLAILRDHPDPLRDWKYVATYTAAD